MGFLNLYVVAGAVLLLGVACLTSYYKGREACRVEVAEEMREIFDKEMEAREKKHQEDVKQASKTNEIIKTVEVEGKEKIKYVERIIKEQPAPTSCLLAGDRLRLLSEVFDSTTRKASTE